MTISNDAVSNDQIESKYHIILFSQNFNTILYMVLDYTIITILHSYNIINGVAIHYNRGYQTTSKF